MSTDTPAPDSPEPAPPPQDQTPFTLEYADASRVVTTETQTEVELFGNLKRDPVKLDGTLKEPLPFREAMSALYGVVGSDYRYVPKDRTMYAAFMRMRRETSHLQLWQAQQAYFSWLVRHDPLAYLILDPIISVYPDGVFFEVFSKDEGSYACLAVANDALKLEGTPSYGTTNIDFSQTLFTGIQGMRSYRETKLSVGREAVSVHTPSAGHAIEKTIRVPDSWVRGFLQVQSAATLPMDSFQLAPIDFYNLLRHLRMNGDKKGQRRGLRIELVPGDAPRLVLEPWEVVLPGTAGNYKGRAPRIARLWGRRRLMMLQRFLPFIKSIDVHLLGSGLPSFWVFRGGPLTITLGLTGFTSANWSQAVSFDLLLPRKTQTTEPVEKVLAHLEKTRMATAADLTKATGLKGAGLVEALQTACQQGRVMYDLAGSLYRLRPLTEQPLDLSKLEYRNTNEKIAHDLLVRRGAVSIVGENRIPGVGLELTGKVSVTEDRRDYRPQLMLADEGHVSKAECTCPHFRKQGLKAGPCPHLVALRLAYAALEAKRQAGSDPKSNVTMETRSYSKRDESGESLVQVSLEKQRLKVRWGRAGKDLRLQTLRFNSVEEARAAYFARIGELDARGYLDATAG